MDIIFEKGQTKYTYKDINVLISDIYSSAIHLIAEGIEKEFGGEYSWDLFGILDESRVLTHIETVNINKDNALTIAFNDMASLFEDILEFEYS